MRGTHGRISPKQLKSRCRYVQRFFFMDAKKAAAFYRQTKFVRKKMACKLPAADPHKGERIRLPVIAAKSSSAHSFALRFATLFLQVNLFTSCIIDRSLSFHKLDQ
jgi:hypothetical protein